MKKKIDIYNKKTVYDQQMRPLVDELLSISRKNNIPIVISAAVANDEEHTEYETRIVLAITELSLFENRIANVLFLMNGLLADAPEDIRDMVRSLTQYLRASVPDADDMINIRLAKDTLTEAYKALCRNIDLHFPESVFPTGFDDDSTL